MYPSLSLTLNETNPYILLYRTCSWFGEGQGREEEEKSGKNRDTCNYVNILNKKKDMLLSFLINGLFCVVLIFCHYFIRIFIGIQLILICFFRLLINDTVFFFFHLIIKRIMLMDFFNGTIFAFLKQNLLDILFCSYNAEFDFPMKG